MNSSSPNSSSMKILVTLIFVISGSLLIDSCIHEPFIDPSSLNNGEPSTPGCVSNGLVCFESSVLPIFISTCAITGCHDSKSRKEGYSLDNYNNIIKKESLRVIQLTVNFTKYFLKQEKIKCLQGLRCRKPKRIPLLPG